MTLFWRKLEEIKKRKNMRFWVILSQLCKRFVVCIKFLCIKKINFYIQIDESFFFSFLSLKKYLQQVAIIHFLLLSRVLPFLYYSLFHSMIFVWGLPTSKCSLKVLLCSNLFIYFLNTHTIDSHFTSILSFFFSDLEFIHFFFIFLLIPKRRSFFWDNPFMFRSVQVVNYFQLIRLFLIVRTHTISSGWSDELPGSRV